MVMIFVGGRSLGSEIWKSEFGRLGRTVCCGPLLPPGFAFSAESAALAQDGTGDTDVLVIL